MVLDVIILMGLVALVVFIEYRTGFIVRREVRKELKRFFEEEGE